ncbi:MAG: hypothetical protein QM504_08110 [Pseudomonadota bacterium]
MQKFSFCNLKRHVLVERSKKLTKVTLWMYRYMADAINLTEIDNIRLDFYEEKVFNNKEYSNPIDYCTAFINTVDPDKKINKDVNHEVIRTVKKSDVVIAGDIYRGRNAMSRVVEVENGYVIHDTGSKFLQKSLVRSYKKNYNRKIRNGDGIVDLKGKVVLNKYGISINDICSGSMFISKSKGKESIVIGIKIGKVSHKIEICGHIKVKELSVKAYIASYRKKAA